MKIIASLFLLFAFASVGLATDSARQGQEDAIREAVFRWQFDNNASGLQRTAKVYCLRVAENDGDPSDEFIGRFAGNKPPVRKASECSTDMREGALDKKTGEKGLVFSVGRITWKSDAEVEVAGGYWEGGLSASGNTYTLKKENGQWKVTSDKMSWIS